LENYSFKVSILHREVRRVTVFGSNVVLLSTGRREGFRTRGFSKKGVWEGCVVVCRREWLEMVVLGSWRRTGAMRGEKRRQRLLNYSDVAVTSS